MNETSDTVPGGRSSSIQSVRVRGSSITSERNSQISSSMSSFLKSTKTPPSKTKTPNQTLASVDCYGLGRMKTDATNAKSANTAESDLLE